MSLFLVISWLAHGCSGGSNDWWAGWFPWSHDHQGIYQIETGFWSHQVRDNREPVFFYWFCVVVVVIQCLLLSFLFCIYYGMIIPLDNVNSSIHFWYFRKVKMCERDICAAGVIYVDEFCGSVKMLVCDNCLLPSSFSVKSMFPTLLKVIISIHEWESTRSHNHTEVQLNMWDH